MISANLVSKAFILSEENSHTGRMKASVVSDEKSGVYNHFFLRKKYNWRALTTRRMATKTVKPHWF